MPSLEHLRALLTADPNDSFVRYGVAMEHAKLGQNAQALAEFTELLRRDPKYVPAYFMGGRTCAQSGDVPAAKELYRRGIAMANQVGDTHAAGEISEALEMLEG